MIKLNKNYFFIICCFWLLSNLELRSQSQIDTLKNKTLVELFNLYSSTNVKADKIKYIQTYLFVAKNKKNKKRILTGYYVLSSLYNNETKLLYYDSIINKTKSSPLDNFPSIAYNSKAIYYHNKGNFKMALDNYLQSNKYVQIDKNQQLNFANTYSIATIKRKIGEYDEALKLYRTCLSFSKKDFVKNKRNYLITLLALSNIFYEKKQVDSAKFYNKLGVKESLKMKDIDKYHHFSINQGITHFIEKKYDLALDSLSKHVKYYKKKKDTFNLSYIYFYLGKTYNLKQNKKVAVKYYRKIDSLYKPNSLLTKEFRASYEYLINYYKNKDDFKKQLFYVNKLIYFDSISNSNENYLSKKIFKEYDIPKLKKEKKLIRNEMEKNNFQFKIILFFFLFLLLLTFSLLFHQNRKRKKYKKRFEEIVNNNSIVKTIVKPKLKNNSIPEEIVNEILIKLADFEKRKSFVSNDITLNSLAKKINTNSNYLSKVVNQYKKTSFSNYLNNLRIEFIVNEIEVNPILRKYTLKALSKEAGFNSAESFTNAFLKLKGIKPSYFLKELEKRNNK